MLRVLFALVAVMVLVLQATAASAGAQGLLEFTPDERRRIAAHGPWPPAPPARDAGNNLSGNARAIALGERLFNDARLSPDGRFSCATCHEPRRAFADGQRRAAGRDEGDRNTPTLLNTGGQRWFGWDGGADSLWHQSIKALLNPREMAATLPQVQAVLAADAGYREAWQALFGTSPARGSADLAAVRAMKAVGAYTATLQSPRTAFDQFREALLAGKADEAAKYPIAAQRGLRLFVGRAGCAICHIGPAFTNGEFADTGLPFFVRPGVVDAGRHGGIQALREGPTARFNLLSRHADRPPTAQRANPASPASPASPADRDETVKTRHVALQHRNFGEFKVPGLRALTLTAPYMHDGSLATLFDVVRHYNQIDLERLHADGDRILKPLNLSDAEEADLVAFLESLSAPAPGPYRVRFEVDLGEAIAAGRFDPRRDGLGLRGSAPPLSWGHSVVVHEPGAKPPPGGRYAIELSFAQAPRGGQPLAYKFKIERPGAAGNEGWEQGRNHSIVIDRGGPGDAQPLGVRHRFDEPAPAPLITLTGRIERQAAFASKHVSPREMQVWLPPGYADASAQARRYPVLYLHDGQNIFDAAAAGAEWGIDEAAQALMARRGPEGIGEAIIVAVSAGTDRIHDYTPWPMVREGRNSGGGGPAYARFLVEELKPFIDRSYRTRPEAEHTAVGGSSLGGLISMWLLLHHADTFGAGLVVSPSVWWANGAIVREVAAWPRAGPPPRVWLDVGRLEGQGMVAGADALRQALQARGWAGTRLGYVEDPDGAHDEASWAGRVPGMLRFLWPR